MPTGARRPGRTVAFAITVDVTVASVGDIRLRPISKRLPLFPSLFRNRLTFRFASRSARMRGESDHLGVNLGSASSDCLPITGQCVVGERPPISVPDKGGRHRISIFINIVEAAFGRSTDALVVASSTAMNGEAKIRRPLYGRLGRRGASGETDAYKISKYQREIHEGPVPSVVGRSEDPPGHIWSPWPAGSEWRNRRLAFLILPSIFQGEKTVRLSKKIAAIAITTGVALTASVAFAAWTASGSGSGSAKAGSAAGLTTVDASASTSLLYPTGSADVKIKIHNPNPYQVTVTEIDGNGPITSEDALCNASHGVTFTDQTGSFVVGADSDQEFILADAAHMSNASVDACQGEDFDIPVSLVGASSVVTP